MKKKRTLVTTSIAVVLMSAFSGIVYSLAQRRLPRVGPVLNTLFYSPDTNSKRFMQPMVGDFGNPMN